MEVAELVLSYLRVLVWPAVALVAIVLFRQPIIRILGRVSEFDAFGVTAKLDAEKRDVEESIAAALQPDLTEDLRRAAIEALVNEATELGRAEAQAKAPPVDYLIELSSEATPRMYSSLKSHNRKARAHNRRIRRQTAEEDLRQAIAAGDSARADRARRRLRDLDAQERADGPPET